MIITSSRHICASLSALLLLLVCLWSGEVQARISGEASLNYSNYDVRDTKAHISSNSFSQDYSLLYDSKGSLYNSRIGNYSIALGYNWSALNTSIDSSQARDPLSPYQETRGHLFFSGDLLVDPKEVPLRLTAYSHDLNRNTFSTSESPVITSMFSQNSGYLLGSPNILTGINDGIHIDSGATLVAGVKNGMTNGYNEVLRHLPMIMLEYRDQINRDLRSATPVDNRLSRLAFVSLNKKDNWFHYRYMTYTDNINATNNYRENQIQLGTVDHTLARRWIDFSNWLQVSTDLQFTKHTSNTNFTTLENFEEIDLNLFGQARRSHWEARSYTNFNRYREDSGKLTLHTTVPVYVSGVLNPELSWSTRTSYRESHDTSGAHLESMLAGYRVDAFKRSLFTVSQHADVESSNSEASNMLVLSGGIETASSSRFSRLYSLAAAYDIKDSLNKNSSGSNSFLEQKLTLRGSYAPTNQLRIMVNQQNEFTSGNNQGFSTLVRDANTALPQYVTPRGISADGLGSSSYHSLSSLSVSWNPLARLYTGFTVSEDIFSSATVSRSSITNISALLDYTSGNLKFNDTFTYADGSTQLDTRTSTISNNATLQYSHSRNLDSRMLFAYSRISENGITSSNVDAEQRLDYTYYSYAGLARKVFEINEMLAYSNSPSLTDIRFSSTNTITSSNQLSTTITNATSANRTSRSSLSLGFKYYPLRQLVVAGGGRYQVESKLSNYSLMWYGSVGLNFRLFQASLDYYQGKRVSDGLLERKFSANVKKAF